MSRLVRYFMVAILVFVGVAHAQIDTGSISGTIKDPSGAVIANASVTVVNAGSGAAVTTKTNSGGLYDVPNLKGGAVTVTVYAQGFDTSTRTGIGLR